MLLTALAGGDRARIGLIATASTTYNEPYNLARRFASLDHVSGGRAGWNIVTTAGRDAARNFDLDDQPAHRERYERAAEFVEVSPKLWDSWDDDAVARRQGGRRLGRRQPRSTRSTTSAATSGSPGRSTCRAPPQGHPLLVQAGSSEDGKDFAARYAEAVFTAQQTLARRAGVLRRPQAPRRRRTAATRTRIKILPGIVPVIGATEAEARELDAELDRLIRPEYAPPQLAELLARRPERPARSTASCPPTCPPRTRSRAPRAATR